MYLVNLALDYTLGIFYFNIADIGIFLALSIPIPGVDVVVAILFALVWGVIGYDAFVALWNSIIVPACGAPELKYFPNV